MKRLIKIYDTTLRDGSQTEGISFSLEDKIRITKKLDELGVHYIEGGWPFSNPKDLEFFEKIRGISLKNSRLTAFGSTRQKRHRAEKDPNLKALVASGAPVITIFGKSWDLHVKNVLGVTLDENLELIRDSLDYLKSRVEEVFYDAEHFFDGYKADPAYALKTLHAAQEAGADCIILCDTNGGTLVEEAEEIIQVVQKEIDTPLGIHTHNDSDLAVANTLTAVGLGINHIQGTINGYGERCGNADLCSVIPNLILKMGLDCISDTQLITLTEVSTFVSELANLKHDPHRPFVGESAFAHKGGIHVSAVQKVSRSYEHIEPRQVGNKQKILISELSGKSNIISKAREFGLDLTRETAEIRDLLKQLKRLEHEGFQFEGAEASFELLMKKAMGLYTPFFDLEGFRVIVERREWDKKPVAEATIKIMVDGQIEHTAATGDGPVNALDNALRKALIPFYPSIQEMSLIDFKVRILNEHAGSSARTRVLIESGDGESNWGTVGVSDNIIEASWQALVDSVEYKLFKDKKKSS
jgi:2-isopropylmalate synthase